MTLLQLFSFPFSSGGQISFMKPSRWAISCEPPVETLLAPLLRSSFGAHSPVTERLIHRLRSRPHFPISGAVFFLSFYLFLERVGYGVVEPKAGWWSGVFGYLSLVINFFHILPWVLFASGKHFPNFYMTWSCKFQLRACKLFIECYRDKPTYISPKKLKINLEVHFLSSMLSNIHC